MLYIDDTRPRPSRKWKLVRSVDEAETYFLRHGCPSIVSFDYNLGDGTGMDIVVWMIERDKTNPGFIPNDFEFTVHSSDPFGARELREALNLYLAKRRITLGARSGLQV